MILPIEAHEYLALGIKAGDTVRYAGSEYVVAHIAILPTGQLMVGIFDEPPGPHIDYLNPKSVTPVKSEPKP